MTLTRPAACILYALTALLALIGTWAHNLHYLDLGFVGATGAFWLDTLVNPASRSITVDLFLLGFAVFVWMLLEARRLGLRGVWLYLLFGMLIAISVTVPLFLLQRERALAAREPGSAAGTLSAADAAGLAALAVATLLFTGYTLT